MHQYVVWGMNQALAAATAETLVQVAAPSTRRLQVIKYGISFDGITADAVPVDVELLRQTTAGTASAFTPRKYEEADPAALSSALSSFTAEPTAGDILDPHQITPLGGMVDFEWAFENRIVVAASGRIGVRATAAAAVNATAFIVVQE